MGGGGGAWYNPVTWVEKAADIVTNPAEFISQNLDASRLSPQVASIQDTYSAIDPMGRNVLGSPVAEQIAESPITSAVTKALVGAGMASNPISAALYAGAQSAANSFSNEGNLTLSGLGKTGLSALAAYLTSNAAQGLQGLQGGSQVGGMTGASGVGDAADLFSMSGIPGGSSYDPAVLAAYGSQGGVTGAQGPTDPNDLFATSGGSTETSDVYNVINPAGTNSSFTPEQMAQYANLSVGDNVVTPPVVDWKKLIEGTGKLANIFMNSGAGTEGGRGFPNYEIAIPGSSVSPATFTEFMNRQRDDKASNLGAGGVEVPTYYPDFDNMNRINKVQGQYYT